MSRDRKEVRKQVTGISGGRGVPIWNSKRKGCEAEASFA